MNVFSDEELAGGRRGPSFSSRGTASRGAETADPYANLVPLLPQQGGDYGPRPTDRSAGPSRSPAHAAAVAAASGAEAMAASQRQAAAQAAASQRLMAELDEAKQRMRAQSAPQATNQHVGYPAQSMSPTAVAQLPGQGYVAPAAQTFGPSMGGAAMAGSVLGQRANATRPAAVTSVPVRPAAQATTTAIPQKPSMSSEEAWLAHLGMNADGWLDLHPMTRVQALQRGGCNASDLPAVIGAIDTAALKKTARTPMVQTAIQPAGQVELGSNQGGVSVGASIPWWLLITVGIVGGGYYLYTRTHY